MAAKLFVGEADIWSHFILHLRRPFPILFIHFSFSKRKKNSIKLLLTESLMMMMMVDDDKREKTKIACSKACFYFVVSFHIS